MRKLSIYLMLSLMLTSQLSGCYWLVDDGYGRGGGRGGGYHDGGDRGGGGDRGEHGGGHDHGGDR